jgi:hypothetical protein
MSLTSTAKGLLRQVRGSSLVLNERRVNGMDDQFPFYKDHICIDINRCPWRVVERVKIKDLKQLAVDG